MSDYPFFIPQVVLFANSSLFWFKVANEHREFRNYLYFIKFPINFCIKFVIEFIWMLYIHRPFLLNLKSVSCSKFKSGGDRLLLMPLIMRTDFLSGHQIRQTCGLLAGNQNFRATKKAPPGC